jgi:hypothetical protein
MAALVFIFSNRLFALESRRRVAAAAPGSNALAGGSNAPDIPKFCQPARPRFVARWRGRSAGRVLATCARSKARRCAGLRRTSPKRFVL